MYINIDSENFVPKDFKILNFYGKDTCFMWNKNEFVYFHYVYQNSTNKLKVLKAPSEIKDIRNFNERIFILCSPNGIYKLTDNLEFASLSKAGIELGTDFFEVFAPNNGILILEDKRLKSTKKIFPLSSSNNIHVLPLNSTNTDASFRKILLSNNDNASLCIFVYEEKLFKMLDQNIQIIYSCDNLIKHIIPVEKEEKIIGAILQTDSHIVIFLHVVNNKLKYDKIVLHSSVKTMCAVICLNNENILFLVYADHEKTYYIKLTLTENLVQEVTTEEKHYETFKLYQSRFMIYLSDSKELLQTNIEQLIKYNHNMQDYIKLEPTMLKGIEKLIQLICDQTVMLQKLKNEVTAKEDNLKRINVYVNKQHLKCCPEDRVIRMLNHVFLVSNFKRLLPENTIVVKMLKNRGKIVFTMKKVKDCDTVIEMPVSIPSLSSKLYTTTDLITYKDDKGLWCLIKNYIQDPLPCKSNKVHFTANEINFVKYKLILLQNLIKENNLSMEVLAKIKKDVRQELDKI